MEHINYICAVSGTTVMFIAFAAIVFRMDSLFQGIDDIEENMDRSELFSFECFRVF